ncbi:DUF1499 domain-containing protein [Acidobacteriota bacterium]
MFILKIITVVVMASVILAAIALMILVRTASKPGHLGLKGGKFAPCPTSPNCVSSQSKDRAKYIEPISYEHSADAARTRLLAILGNRKNGTVIEAQDRYVHVEFRSRLFAFVDDAEFYLDEEAKVLHLRSASRVGYSDLGANRRRLEEIRSAFLETVAASPVSESR